MLLVALVMAGLALVAPRCATAGDDLEAHVLDALRRQAAERGEPAGQSFGQAGASPAVAYRGKGRHRGKRDGKTWDRSRSDRDEWEKVLNERARRAQRGEPTEGADR